MKLASFSRFLFVVAGLCLMAASVSAQIPGCENCPPTGSFVDTFSGAQTQTGHLNRDSIASTCSGKAFPGTEDPGLTLNYESYSYTNYGSAAACVTVNFNPSGVVRGNIACGTNAQVAAYLAGYDPNDQSAGYLGDSGTSAASSFSFQVPPNSDFVVVVSNSAAAATCDYSLEIADVPCQMDTSVCDLSLSGVPTLGLPGILTLVLLLGVAAAFLLRRQAA